MKHLIITLLCLTCLNGCKTTNNTSSTYMDDTNRIKKLLDSTDLGVGYHGAILIADEANVLFEKAYGVDQDNKPNRLDRKYDLASMGKMFTAIATMQLREAGKLTLEQTIGEILPDYPNVEAKQITVRQLLSHTSGLGDFFGPEFDKNRDAIKSLEDYLPFFVNDPLEFPPGEQMRYSNAGFIVLGLIIEKLSGIGYNQYVTKNIFQPLEMNATGDLASSAGGGHSTVGDLHKFALALKNNSLISNESFVAMTTDHFDNGYGYGMSLRDLNGKKVFGHNGGAPGTSGELDMVMDEPLIIVSMSNRSPMDGWAQVRTHMRKVFFGNTPEIEQFLNTEQVVKTYQEEGFEKASELLGRLDNKISDRNTFRFAEKYAMEGQAEKAIDILKLIVQAYPDQWYPYSFLADFQLQAGQKKLAIENYKKSLEMNPQNEQALERLKELEQSN